MVAGFNNNNNIDAFSSILSDQPVISIPTPGYLTNRRAMQEGNAKQMNGSIDSNALPCLNTFDSI